jgi:peptidoglycan/xylan/chitin deacetylase (PgdA/CDA1 family)
MGSRPRRTAVLAVTLACSLFLTACTAAYNDAGSLPATGASRAASVTGAGHRGGRAQARPVRTRPLLAPDRPLGTLAGAPGIPRPLPAGAIALTFDDGPNPRWTPQILAILARYHVHATFFVIGANVARYPGLVRAEFTAGDGVGNHTETHPDLTSLTAAADAAQIDAAADAIASATGTWPVCMRPPYDAIDPAVESVTAQQHEALMLYDIDPRDWQRPGVAAIVARVLAGAHPGAVIDMHDAGGDRSQTVAALPLILAGLALRHLTPVPLCRA